MMPITTANNRKNRSSSNHDAGEKLTNGKRRRLLKTGLSADATAGDRSINGLRSDNRFWGLLLQSAPPTRRPIAERQSVRARFRGEQQAAIQQQLVEHNAVLYSLT